MVTLSCVTELKNPLTSVLGRETVERYEQMGEFLVFGGYASLSLPFWRCWRGGMTEREILEAYPDLEPEDIREALPFAAEKERTSP